MVLIVPFRTVVQKSDNETGSVEDVANASHALCNSGSVKETIHPLFKSFPNVEMMTLFGSQPPVERGAGTWRPDICYCLVVRFREREM